MRRILHTAVLFSMCCLAVLSVVFAGDGYRLDYDYPGQGDDWYGGSGAPDSRRDYPALNVDQAWNGDDYGVGYERMLDPFRFGPPLELFVNRHTAYEFRFGNRFAGPCDLVAPPGEVAGLRLSRAAPGSTVATLSWDDRGDAVWFNVYRGENPRLDDLACYESGIAGVGVDDDGSIPPTGLYVYLVTAGQVCGEGTLGTDSDTNLRASISPCP